MYHQNVFRQPVRKITVVGNGQVAVEPDVATIQFEVRTVDEQVRVAQEENAAIMNQVIQSFVQLGIPRANIQTVSYTIYPKYDYVDGEQVFRGYEVNNAISVKLTNIDQVGIVIDTAVANGANRVSSIQFSVEDPSMYEQEAIVAALQDAQTKAQTIAKSMQLAVPPQPIRIVEEVNRVSPTPYYSVAAAEKSTTPIEKGQLVITATMRVDYSF